MKSYCQLLMESYCKSIVAFQGKEKSMEQIRSHLNKFDGGSIDVHTGEDGIAVVTLNHEERKNAISGKMMVDLHDVVQKLESWKTGKAVLIQGSGGNFCSGGDLNTAKKTGTAEEGFMMATYMHGVLERFERLPLISLACIDGIGALGGGAELSVACDHRLMSENCKGLGFVQAKMGILPAWGGTARLVRIAGYRNALQVLSTAKIFSPRECLQLGIVDQVFPASCDSTETAISWLRERTTFDAQVIRSIKISALIARDFPQDTETERRIFAPFWGSPGNQEALRRNIKHKPEER